MEFICMTNDQKFYNLRQKMTVPNFFIVGAPKCGTTSLYEYLRTHPNIFLPKHKEPNFFAEDFPNMGGRIDDWDTYLNIFKRYKPEHIAVGDSSILYLCSDVALERIYEYNPNAKIVVMVRNPVDMFLSEHSQLLYSYYESEKDGEKAWHLQKKRANGFNVPKTCREPKILQYNKVCSLGTQLERLMQIFPRDQIKVILFDDFINSTNTVYRDTLSFLGLKSDGRVLFPKINMHKVHRWNRLSQLLISPPKMLQKTHKKLRKGYATSNNPITNWIVRIGMILDNINSTNKKRKAISNSFRLELEETFENEIAKISVILNRDLNSWFKIKKANQSYTKKVDIKTNAGGL
jgi:hypothetical protein